MLKNFLTIPLLLSVLTAFSQPVKPIAQMVDQAKSFQTLKSVSFFNKQTTPATDLPEISNSLQAGTILQWDDTKAQQLKSAAGTPVSLTIPWENGSEITLDLVPAKNFSDQFQVHTASTQGGVYQTDPGIHFWGIIHNNPQSLVCISLFDKELMGVVSSENGHFTIGALTGSTEKAHIIYKDADLKNTPEFNCSTDDNLHKIGEDVSADSRSVGPDNCVRMFIETDYTLFQNKGSVANVVTYMTGVFSQVSALYTNESVNVVLHDLFVWDITDPYTGPAASNYLTQFRDAKNGVFNGDLAHLVGINGLGGVAYLDVLCNGFYSVGYSSINATYSNVPTYSWTVEVLTHEIGHNLGSSHTHACVWNGNNTAIDGCGPTAGYSEGCTAALPTNGGTIMSYCHLVSGVGINFNNGFGPQPGDRIRNEVYNAPCLNACGGGGACTYTTINSNNFESGFGIWTDGGTDCVRTNNATYANSPTYSILLRDNTTTSVMSTTNQNWAAYEEITVDFSYYTVSFESGEDFWVQKSTNGGSTYTTIGDFNAGTQFTNGVHQTGQVVIPGPFTSTTRLRFRADASADDDRVYIDDVVISGCSQQLTGGELEDRTKEWMPEVAENTGIANFLVGPNPAHDDINIQFDAEQPLQAYLTITDLTGKTLLRTTIYAIEGVNRISVPLTTYANGLYILSVNAGDDVFTNKVIIAR